MICGCGDEKKCVLSIPWNVILMVLGVGILMKVVTLSGGIKLMVAFLQSVMNPATASTFMALFILAVLAFTGIYTIIL